MGILSVPGFLLTALLFTYCGAETDYETLKFKYFMERPDSGPGLVRSETDKFKYIKAWGIFPKERFLRPAKKEKRLQNDRIKVGVDLTRGGSIGYMEDETRIQGNVINTHDMGREVQLSFYSGPKFYNPDN
eukprot:gene15573-4683_t